MSFWASSLASTTSSRVVVTVIPSLRRRGDRFTRWGVSPILIIPWSWSMTMVSRAHQNEVCCALTLVAGISFPCEWRTTTMRRRRLQNYFECLELFCMSQAKTQSKDLHLPFNLRQISALIVGQMTFVMFHRPIVNNAIFHLWLCLLVREKKEKTSVLGEKCCHQASHTTELKQTFQNKMSVIAWLKTMSLHFSRQTPARASQMKIIIRVFCSQWQQHTWTLEHVALLTNLNSVCFFWQCTFSMSFPKLFPMKEHENSYLHPWHSYGSHWLTVNVKLMSVSHDDEQWRSEMSRCVSADLSHPPYGTSSFE